MATNLVMVDGFMVSWFLFVHWKILRFVFNVLKTKQMKMVSTLLIPVHVTDKCPRY